MSLFIYSPSCDGGGPNLPCCLPHPNAQRMVAANRSQMPQREEPPEDSDVEPRPQMAHVVARNATPPLAPDALATQATQVRRPSQCIASSRSNLYKAFLLGAGLSIGPKASAKGFH